jgi:hypothetical protein
MHPQTWIGQRVEVVWPPTSTRGNFVGVVKDTTPSGFDLEDERGARYFIAYGVPECVRLLRKGEQPLSQL